MHLHVILCFALLIWWPHERPFAPLIGSPVAICLIVWAQVPLFLAAAAWCSAMALGRLNRVPAEPNRGQVFCHRATFCLRLAAILAFLAVVGLTDWTGLVRSISLLSAVPGAADLVILSPFLAASTAIFVGLYPIDRAIRRSIIETWATVGQAENTGNKQPASAADRQPAGAADAQPSGAADEQPAGAGCGHPAGAAVWNWRQYLNFNVRHHLLVVAVPMTLILVAFDLARDHEEALVRLLRVPWAAEAAPGLAAGVVFLFAPAMLRRIWTTRPLPDGPLRRELQHICDRIKLPHRDILVWQSGGMMVNAAVMGLFRHVRYVMLSDGLLEAMSAEQIKAVFGHEAGHVRHRHIQFFLLFAVCSMLLLSGVVEALRLGVEHRLFELDWLTIQGLGLLAALAFWAVGFGWLSRRFERQADVFGAFCVTPDAPGGCTLPCSIHGHEPGYRPPASAVCATATRLFVSALRRVALLNGMPQEERSWRHSSIASRIHFLTSLAGDPLRANRFDRLIRRVKRLLLAVTVTGLLVAALYVWHHPIYGVDAPRPAARRPAPAVGWHGFIPDACRGGSHACLSSPCALGPRRRGTCLPAGPLPRSRVKAWHPGESPQGTAHVRTNH